MLIVRESTLQDDSLILPPAITYTCNRAVVWGWTFLEAEHRKIRQQQLDRVVALDQSYVFQSLLGSCSGLLVSLVFGASQARNLQ